MLSHIHMKRLSRLIGLSLLKPILISKNGLFLIVIGIQSGHMFKTMKSMNIIFLKILKPSVVSPNINLSKRTMIEDIYHHIALVLVA